MSEEKSAPKTKEELIAMLKDQLDRVEVEAWIFRIKSAICRLLSRKSERKGNYWPRNCKKKRQKCNSSSKIKQKPLEMYPTILLEKVN